MSANNNSRIARESDSRLRRAEDILSGEILYTRVMWRGIHHLMGSSIIHVM